MTNQSDSARDSFDIATMIVKEQRRAYVTHQANVAVTAAAYLLSAHMYPSVARALALEALREGAAEIARLGGTYHYRSKRLEESLAEH